MPAKSRALPGLLRCFRMAAWCIGLMVVPDSVQHAVAVDADTEYGQQIFPLVMTHCLDCHSTSAKKGGLDLERFATLQHVRADIELWQSVLEMLENDAMPPRGKKRLRTEERSLLTDWISGLLKHVARDRAGDPGPALVRRLNNAEYRYTIRDLTGVDVDPGRYFPADGAAGEGFLNATEALAISSDRVSMYLNAAKETVAHVVLLPNGFRFSKSKFREDQVNEVLAEIIALHETYATEIGEIPLDRYLAASVAHRDALDFGKLSVEALAIRQKLSPKYLRILWQVMTDERPSVLLDGLRMKWKGCRAAVPDAAVVADQQDDGATGEVSADLNSLAEDIVALQDLLWHKRLPGGAHILDDRFEPASVLLAESHRYKFVVPKASETVFYLVAQTMAGHVPARLILDRPRFESGGESFLLSEILRKAAHTSDTKQNAVPRKAFSRIDPSRFGRHPNNEEFDKTSLLLQGSEVLEVRLPGSLASEQTFVVDVRLDPSSSAESVVRFEVRPTPAAAQVDRSLAWQYRESEPGPPLLVLHNDAATAKAIERSADEFRRIFPARVCYPGVIVRDTAVTLERYHRGDGHLSHLMLDTDEHEQLDRLWDELHFISGDALQVKNSMSTLTQGEMTAYKLVQDEIDRRAEQADENRLASRSYHLNSVFDFASRAFRRLLTESERESLRDLYHSLRTNQLSHEEALRTVLARVLVSPSFLFRIEQPQPGEEPQRVSDWELATRLSYFLWSSLPDEELRQFAASGQLCHRQTLEQQTRRMLEHPRCRALAVEFGTQWLEVRTFEHFQGKDEKLFPTFDAGLRRAMDEESILFFQDAFQADRSFRQLIDADHTFLNETLAEHYSIPGIRGDEFRRVDGTHGYGRGGILGLATVLARHSGAARTSPVLRGNWIAETLLGERLPRPPADVPKLPEGESDGTLTVREMVEQHARVQECAVCHQRIDPLGFALEQFDTIGRRRDTDHGGRLVDDAAELRDGTRFEGIDGLRQYLLTQRKDDLVRQFCRKLLGYALGRRVILSDQQLLNEMAAELGATDGRLSSAVLAIVHSKQFQFVRGSEFAGSR